MKHMNNVRRYGRVRPAGPRVDRRGGGSLPELRKRVRELSLKNREPASKPVYPVPLRQQPDLSLTPARALKLLTLFVATFLIAFTLYCGVGMKTWHAGVTAGVISLFATLFWWAADPRGEG